MDIKLEMFLASAENKPELVTMMASRIKELSRRSVCRGEKRTVLAPKRLGYDDSTTDDEMNPPHAKHFSANGTVFGLVIKCCKTYLNMF